MSDLPVVNYQQQQRISLQKMYPANVGPPQLLAGIVQSSNATINGPYSVPNTSSLTIQSIIVAKKDPTIPLGAIPYCIAFFQGSLSTANIIGSGITGSGYVIKGPFAMPTFTPHATNNNYGGSDGNNLVFVTELYNATGSTQNIYYISNTKIIQSSGGGVT